MALRATDVKDEHGWQIADAETGEIVGHGPSRDKARAAARTPEDLDVEWTPVEGNGAVQGEVLPPAPKSPEELAADRAFKVDQRIKAINAEMKGLWVELAANLYVFMEGEMWRDLGYETSGAYYADPDVDINIRHAYDLIAAYKQLVIDRGVEPEDLKQLEVSKVKEALPAIRREQVTWEEAKADIQALSKSSLITKYKGTASSTPGEPDTKVKIETDQEPTWGRCPTCGTRKRVDPKTGEFMGQATMRALMEGLE